MRGRCFRTAVRATRPLVANPHLEGWGLTSSASFPPLERVDCLDSAPPRSLLLPAKVDCLDIRRELLSRSLRLPAIIVPILAGRGGSISV